jgi:hypothetical protein
MIDLGLVAPRGTSIGQTGDSIPVDVLWPTDERAAELADRFRNAVAGTEYVERYFASDHDIPREVLIEYAQVACICRLSDLPDEQAALRTALLDPSPSQPMADVTRRREAFAFLLWLATQNERVVRDDAAFRDQIWSAYEHGLGRQRDSLHATNARWAALVAKECYQEGISTIWARVCETGLGASDSSVAAAEVDRVLIDPLARASILSPFGEQIAVEPDTPTTDLAERMAAVSRGRSLEAIRDWSVRDGSAIAGLALILALDDRVATMGAQAPGWSEIASQDGERQPGVVHLRLRLAAHLEPGPTIRSTMGWLVRHWVLWPHEAIAYSKLPQSTFRFRWESGRLQFFDLRPERFRLTDIRRDALGRLGADMGLFDWTQTGAVPTAIGRAFVDEVYG